MQQCQPSPHHPAVGKAGDALLRVLATSSTVLYLHSRAQSTLCAQAQCCKSLSLWIMPVGVLFPKNQAGLFELQVFHTRFAD